MWSVGRGWCEAVEVCLPWTAVLVGLVQEQCDRPPDGDSVRGCEGEGGIR